VCTAGSRIFVQEAIYDQFLTKFTAAAKAVGAGAGDPFAPGTLHGPQVSQTQFDVRLLCFGVCLRIDLQDDLACYGVH
jgi:acyl-CoA reductase-like NAD-dependent aldehyde dehydrogenase